jgi:hypothetical protein
MVLACVVVLAASVAVAGGSAGNRTGEVKLEVYPSASVTYGENIGYVLTFENTGKSTFTHVEARQQVPVATFGASSYPATLVGSSCGAVVQGSHAVCSFGSMSSGASIRATFVWRAPTIPSATGCTDCVTTEANVSIKEGKPTNDNENFGTGAVKASLFATDGSQETKRAGGYETEAATCTSATGNLHTNQVLHKTNNPVTTTVCFPAFTIPAGSPDVGFASTIVESSLHQHPGGHPELGQSDVCIAALGQNCTSGYTPQNFFPQVATIIFRIHNDAITSTVQTMQAFSGWHPPPSGKKKITQVFHNTVLLPKCQVDPTFPEGCVESITQDHWTKNWTVVVKASTNGFYDW